MFEKRISKKKKYEQLIRELDRWVRVYRSRPTMRQLITKVENGREFWFTCVLHPEIEPTNNSAERGLRKFVVMEKDYGLFAFRTRKKRHYRFYCHYAALGD